MPESLLCVCSFVRSWIYGFSAAPSAGRCSGLFDLYLRAAQTQAQYLSEHSLCAHSTPTLGWLHTSFSFSFPPFLLETHSPTLGGPGLIIPDPNGPADLQRQTVTDGAMDLICVGRPRYIIPMSRVPLWVGIFFMCGPSLKHAGVSSERPFFCCCLKKTSDLFCLLDNYHAHKKDWFYLQCFIFWHPVTIAAERKTKQKHVLILKSVAMLLLLLLEMLPPSTHAHTHTYIQTHATP